MSTLLSLYEKRMETDPAEKAVLTVVDSRLQPVRYTFGEIDQKMCRAAAVLKACGCQKGDRVLISARETLRVWTFFLGALKLGAVPCVLFPDLGMGGLEVRLKAAGAAFLVTDADPSKLSASVSFPGVFKRVILLGRSGIGSLFTLFDENEWEPLTGNADAAEDDDAFIVFTSGTSGTPKPVLHRHGIADAVIRSMRNVLHAEPSDVYWCTAHPAWITGTVYGILGPLLCGIPSIQYEGKFHARRWMPILQDQKVSLWYTAPTALRALMREDPTFFEDFDLSALKQIYSIGEPLSEKVFNWVSETFHRLIYDTWFQTECGTIRIASQPDQPVRPGWMGRAVDDTVIMTEGAGNGMSGKLVLQSGFESMFREYAGMPEATAEKVKDGLFETGDIVSFGTDGYLRYEGRADEVINTSGHLVSPLEVEQVLTADPAVSAAAVTAEPDELLYEAAAAFIVLADGQEWTRSLETALKVAVNSSVSVYAVPKHFYLLDALPQTSSGKVSHAELKKMLTAGSLQPVSGRR